MLFICENTAVLISFCILSHQCDGQRLPTNMVTPKTLGLIRSALWILKPKTPLKGHRQTVHKLAWNAQTQHFWPPRTVRKGWKGWNPFDNLKSHPFLLWNLLFGFPSLQIVWKLKSISLIFFSYFFEVWAILPLRMIDWLQINIEFVRFIPVFPRYNSRWNIGRINIILEYLWVILYREIKMMLR